MFEGKWESGASYLSTLNNVGGTSAPGEEKVKEPEPVPGVHKVSQTRHCNGNGGGATTTTTTVVSDHDLDEGDDGFIDLQFSLHGVKFRVFTPKKLKPEITKHEERFTRENSCGKQMAEPMIPRRDLPKIWCADT
ncbi:hypothetical protein F3Y22_tig00111330pilonHSYRG01025 [Hibiscus syriacus]|uniref:Uncharacterized protein n=1 Tax=Hibiscus syriacus TaxID=106335 RepID=A0A6A2YQE0_HIBSY|nr:hypothetical protein F3Y22_tig00111330pilonHSYRG01025 [Hibiscus syriacus]